jgi:hypothetical protein
MVVRAAAAAARVFGPGGSGSWKFAALAKPRLTGGFDGSRRKFDGPLA